MTKYLRLTLGHHGDLELKFKIRNTPVAELWIERMNARGSYPLDHPDRFFHFGTPEQEQKRAVDAIQKCIAVINSHQPIITRPFEYTQDCLNYLHSIFEQYHGLLNQQNTDYWNHAPDSVRNALAELNLAVHRCENAVNPVSRKSLICTWYGIPKTKQLDADLQERYTETQITFGTVYLHYCEIGKTAEDLANDNDKYISDDAFKPFDHYSADFDIRFYNQDLMPLYGKIQNYIDQHSDFFLAKGITNVYNVRARPIKLPLADLVYDGNKDQLINHIAQRQWVQQVTLE